MVGGLAAQSVGQPVLNNVFNQRVTVPGLHVRLCMLIAHELHAISVDDHGCGVERIERDLHSTRHLVGCVGMHHVGETVERRVERPGGFARVATHF